MVKAYPSFESRMGDSLNENTLVGPLYTKISVEEYLKGIEEIKK